MFIDKVSPCEQHQDNPPAPAPPPVYVEGGEKKKGIHKGSANETFGPANVWLHFCRQKFI